jgi:hypothetical protein
MYVWYLIQLSTSEILFGVIYIEAGINTQCCLIFLTIPDSVQAIHLWDFAYLSVVGILLEKYPSKKVFERRID